MGTDVWFKDDIANVMCALGEADLAALATASRDPGELGGRTPTLRQAWHEGFAAALVAVAVALGLPLPASTGGAGRRSGAHIREVTRDGITQIADPPGGEGCASRQ